MNATKYVAMYVHKSTAAISVIDSDGQFESPAVVKISAQRIRDFIKALSGTIHLTFEEGTHAQWLVELLRHVVAELLVCKPRLTGSSKTSNKNDKLDSMNLARYLRAGHLKRDLEPSGEKYFLDILFIELLCTKTRAAIPEDGDEHAI